MCCRKEMGVARDIEVVFIDGVIDEEFAHPAEFLIFKNETEKMEKFMTSGEPYLCSEATCRSTAFQFGIPTTMDMEMGSLRYGLSQETKNIFLFSLFSSEG